ncbi:GNAT family N-acetyltransferase [Lactobacillus sp. S2-2]|uniref:GNAT family N-acetyltransferase n=1 Tax=Lactobacillus sp. S2-2 TaxID=2692917 RepID=UPI001F296DC2|nr:GNAT family N-acetyltransferase [Lactobacillus sp. S2-2]MCF6515734.1 GNAT family N-acetyltransferase [Lactobacillus sp. S2-2]
MEKKENISFKAMTNDDLKALQEMSIITFTDTYGSQNTKEDLDDFLTNAYSTEKLQSELNNKDSFFYFGLLNDEIAGYLKLNVNEAQSEAMGNNTLEVERIYVLPEFKGRGLGRKFLEKSFDKANQLGKTKIWLGVWEKNYPALKFYQHFDFVETSSHFFTVGDDQQTDLIMTKEL